MSPIINLQRRLAESGRIRIGVQVATSNGKKRPSKLEQFRLTSSNEAAINAVAKRYGGAVRPWADAPVGNQWELFTESSVLDVLVPPEAMSFSQFYELWSGGGCKRRCNGAYQVPSEDDCVCDPDNRECKPHTRLSVMLADLPGSGLWRLDTQGWNAANELGGAFELAQLISNATGRAIVPGKLRLDQREVKRPDEATRKFAVPVLDFDVDMNALARGVQVAIGSGLTPVPDFEPMKSLGDELEAVNHPAASKPRANAAEPIKRTGLAPHVRGPENSNELMTDEQSHELGDLIASMTDFQREFYREAWKERQFPPLASLTSVLAPEAIALAKQVVEGEDTTIHEAESTASGEPVVNVSASEILPPGITKPQVGKVNGLFRDLGFEDREQVHLRTSAIVGHAVASVNDLTKAEAHKVIDQLSEDVKALSSDPEEEPWS